MGEVSVKPWRSQIVVRRDAKQEVSKGGIILAEKAQEVIPRGEVLAIGPGRLLDNGTLKPIEATLSVGDSVRWNPYGGTKMDDLGDGIMCIDAADIRCYENGPEKIKVLEWLKENGGHANELEDCAEALELRYERVRALANALIEAGELEVDP